ncbi:sulfotransferase family 2 domain-containing protein [Breoghania sp. L-A4]|uniref:sulfotransferase family 2 domain-containing protein n=1 Tax=Breoghania sp. L-A4 TaxID=2304600 RepID=UPI0013C2C8E1|nr:sulfotransferase family 2 domain-containing protein [Breoghania sp. L-A4]
MYFKVGRAASTSIIAIMTQLQIGDTAGRISDAARFVDTAWTLFPKSNICDEVNFRLFNPGLRRFTVVRNPLDRLCSFYNLLNHTADTPATYPRLRRATDPMRHNKRIHEESLEDYLQRIIQLPDAEMDEHIRPQASLVRLDQVKYDHICRFENLNCDMSEMFTALDLPSSYLEQFKRPINSSNHVKSGAMIPPALKRKVEERYHRDYETFGY